MQLKSRILKFINKDLMTKLNSIALDVLIPDNNKKMDLYIAAFEEFDIPYQELGPGTNRAAFLIDGYVFKIGFDKAGIADNWAEFSLSQELQPFVTKCYECNGLITVQEYITVISKEEFNNSKEEVRQILSHLADSYLLGDVGSVTKNFMNWGYRNDGSLVILDYAYIYRVIGDELMCEGVNSDDSICTGSLEYDINFHKLICPRCRKQYTFHEIRRKIDKSYEEKEKNAIKDIAYKLTKPSQDINKNIGTTIVENTDIKGENSMSKYHCFNTDNNYNEEPVMYDDSTYEEAIEFMKNFNTPKVEEVVKEETHEDIIVNDKLIEDVADSYVDSDIENIIEDVDDDTDFTSEEIMSIIDHHSEIEEENNEIEATSDEDDQVVDSMNDYLKEVLTAPVENIDEGSIISTDVADDVFEEDPEEKDEFFNAGDIIDSNTSDESTSITEVEVTSVTTEEVVVVPSTSTTNVNIIIPGSNSTTVTMEVGDDIVVLTTPDDVAEMRALLAADIDDKYDQYDEMFDGNSNGFQKIPKKKRDFK